MSSEPRTPVVVVRDLRAIAHSLLAARRAEAAPAAELAKLEAAERAFARSLESTPTATFITDFAARAEAERGLLLLSEALCRESASARVFVSAWGRRLGGRG